MDELRPETWDAFIGQEAIKRELNVRIAAALAQVRALDPVLLLGKPGDGKTSLAKLIAKQLGEEFESYTMPISKDTLNGIVRRYSGVVLFDELHRASDKLQEELLPLLEFGYLQSAEGLRVHAGWLIIIGASTEPKKIIEPLWDRFVIKPDFDPYTTEEMGLIVQGMARKAGVELTPETAEALGQAAAGTPRNARQLVLAARDLEVTTGRPATTEEILGLCRVDSTGLSVQHVRYIEVLGMLGGRASIKTLSTLLRLNESVVTNLERVLFGQGYVELTARGRVLTRTGSQFLKGKEK